MAGTRVILVVLKTDNPKNGSVTVCCGEIRQDPLLPTHLLMVGITGLSWPFGGAWVGVERWSVPKDLVMNWKLGPIRSQPTLTMDKLNNEGQDIPRLPGTVPSRDMDNDPAAIGELVQNSDEQAERALQAQEAMARRAKVDESKKETDKK